MSDYFDSTTGEKFDIPKGKPTIARTKDLVPADIGEIRIGDLVYISSEGNPERVLPHKIRGKIQSLKRMRWTKENGDEEWSNIEPDWSYNQYRRSIYSMLERGLILLDARDKKADKGESHNTQGRGKTT